MTGHKSSAVAGTPRSGALDNTVLDIVNAAGMDETYGTYVDDECFDIHDDDDDTDHDTDHDTDDDTADDTDDSTDDDTDDGGCGNLYTTKVPGCCEYFLHQRLKQ